MYSEFGENLHDWEEFCEEIATNLDTLASQLVVTDEFSAKVKAELKRVDSFTQAYDEAEKEIGDHAECENALSSATDGEKGEGHESINNF
jgi:hypothetical protein